LAIEARFDYRSAVAELPDPTQPLEQRRAMRAAMVVLSIQ
jgi:hypothetical protein